ncbi:MAG: retropepsin-like aspartic protease family protein [Magnetospiraceae bacterium]
MSAPQPGPWNPTPTPGGSPPSGGGGRRYAIFLVLLAIGVALLIWRFPAVVDDTDAIMRLVAAFAWIALIGTFFLHRGFRLKKAARDAAIWLGIGLTLFLGYTFREDFGYVAGRLGAELVPGSGSQEAGGAMRFVKGPDGHFHVEAFVNNTPIRFLVDTGASVVVLSQADAARLGYDPQDLRFSHVAETANGRITMAPLRLSEVRIGDIRVGNVRAAVNGAPMNVSLLGMSFFNEIGGFSMSGDSLTLTP